MEITCSRCHQTLESGDCFCPVCGLPQLVYNADGAAGQGQPEQWVGAARDASQVEWKPALRSVLALAIPAGLFCSIPSPVGIFGVLLMAGTAALVVALYMRIQRPAWITIGAGARIGLVTGILAGSLFFAASSAMIFAQRYGFHQGNRIDSDWKAFVDSDLQLSQQIAGMVGLSDPAQAAQLQAQQRSLMLSPEGHAGMVLANLVMAALFFVIFATTGGALGARMLGRTRRPQS
jgi:RNA polymerase subunit RPABC4/transcription elongation factor Spt4